MKINIITLGCSKNTADSEHLAGGLAAKGHSVHFDRQRNDCDVTIVNTCGFIGDAKEESVNALLEQIGIKTRGHRTRHLIACGCLVERYRKELQQEMPEVDGWYGVHQWEEMIEKIDSINSIESINSINSIPPPQPLLSTPSHYAYLKIAEGCNRSCSYCAIPLIRGAHHSRPIEELVAEAKQLVHSGVKELIVISQDTTYYGLDLYHRRALGELLERLAIESGAEWIRLHYTYPSSFPDDVIDIIARYDNICNYIDIPLQHINTRLLSSMQRGIDREGTLQLLNRFRQKLPNVAIRTTLIVGYPGESDEEFEELKEFVSSARFDRMGCFAYSAEEGTPAEHLGDPVPNEVKQQRLSELMAIQENISLERNLSRVGHTYRCLIDRIEGNYLVARTEYDSPEVDDEVLIEIPTNRTVRNLPQAGQFVQATIVQAFENDLIAHLA